MQHIGTGFPVGICHYPASATHGRLITVYELAEITKAKRRDIERTIRRGRLPRLRVRGVERVGLIDFVRAVEAETAVDSNS